MPFNAGVWQYGLVVSDARFVEPAIVKAPVECLSSPAPVEVCATSDPYLVLHASLDSLNMLLCEQRQQAV